MFELNKMEKTELVANCDQLNSLKHSTVNPLGFTEQGVAMLTSALHSEKAIRINIEIMRAFAKYSLDHVCHSIPAVNLAFKIHKE
jgi:hypothetical protein